MPIKTKALSEALDAIKKIDPDASDRDDAGQGAVSTGSIAVDIATGIGGFPRGRVSEAAGLEGGGKTTLCMMAVAAAQRSGLYPVYIDVECALDLLHAERIGFDYKDQTKGLFVTPRTVEDVLRIIHQMVTVGADLIIVDSVPGLVTENELSGDVGELSPVAIRARVLSSALPKLANLVKKSKTALVFINQYRQTLQAQGMPAFGRNEQTSGGMALRYFSSMRMRLSQTKKSHTTREALDVTGQLRKFPVASLHEVEIVKSKVSSPYRKLSFLIRYDDKINVFGIDNLFTLIEIAMAQDLVEKRGSWIQYNSVKHQGTDAFYEYLRSHPEDIASLKQGLIDKGILPKPVP